MRFRTRMAFSRPLVFSLLFGLFLLCFVLTPLWNTLPGLPWKGAFLILSLAMGFAWAWWGSGDLRSPTVSDGLRFLFLFALVAALNFRALSASIPWRGDEEYHVFFAARLARLMASHLPYLAALAAFLAWGWIHREMDRKVMAGAFVFGICAAWAGHSAHLDIYHVLRYPIFLKYLAALPVYVSSLLPADPFPEIPYRIIPLISAAGLSWLGFRGLGRHPLPIRLGATLAIATLPLVRYYGTLFYLEMPAVLCMTLVCFQAVPLLRADLRNLVRLPGWYALLLIGFIKETTLPFLAAFLVCRLLFRLSALMGSSSVRKAWLREAAVVFCVGVPLCLYLFYRLRLNDSRSYHPGSANLFDPRLLLLEARSWRDSFGLLTPLALAGALLALRRRKWASLIFPGLAFALVFLFHFLDDSLYVGYSRFNLFLLPSLLALAWEALRFGAVRFPSSAMGALTLIVVANVFLSPVNSDGSRRPHWGAYGSDIGDHSYPYRQALLSLKLDHAGQKTRLTGLYYPYPADFYLEPGEMPELSLVGVPADEGMLMDSLLAASAREGFDAVLYHVLGDSLPALPDHHGYGNTQVFSNRAHILVLFSR